jgi:hypothetical protein
MTNLALDLDDAVVLQQILEVALHALRVEIIHTDNRAFRRMLEDREDKLEALLARVTQLVLASASQAAVEH